MYLVLLIKEALWCAIHCSHMASGSFQEDLTRFKVAMMFHLIIYVGKWLSMLWESQCCMICSSSLLSTLMEHWPAPGLPKVVLLAHCFREIACLHIQHETYIKIQAAARSMV